MPNVPLLLSFVLKNCLLAAMGAFSMLLWVFHPIIPTVLHQWGLPQICGILMVNFLCLSYTYIYEFLIGALSDANCTYFLNCSLSWWTSLHINFTSAWWGPKWLWACKWALDTCPHGTYNLNFLQWLFLAPLWAFIFTALGSINLLYMLFNLLFLFLALQCYSIDCRG